MPTHPVQLHGGPWHGRVVAVQDGRDHFHIIGPLNYPPKFVEQDPDEPGQIQTREGTYSVVRYSPDDFEWDGWVTHD